MVDPESRLAQLEELSDRIDAAFAAGETDRAEQLSAEMADLVTETFGARQTPGPLPPIYAALHNAIVTADLETLAATVPRLDLTTAHGAEGTFPLLWAMSAPAHRPEILRILVSAGADANQATVEGNTALHSLAGPSTYTQGSDLGQVVGDLHAAGADLEARQHWGWTPLHRAIIEGTLAEMEALLCHGADPNAKVGLARGQGLCTGLTPLMIAGAETEKVDVLLDYGADPSRQNAAGQSAVRYLQREASSYEARLAGRRSAGSVSAFDRAYAQGLRRSADRVARPPALRH